MTISYIIPSLNRRTLTRTIDSIEARAGDEIIVEYDKPRMNMWGNPQRNLGMAKATGDWLAFIDDDDYYVPGHREIQEQAMIEARGMPILFRMKYPSGNILWKDKRIYPGNVSTPMILVPNNKEMLHYWEGRRNTADYIFISKWKWPRTKTVWREEIIALIGSDIPNYILHK